MLRQQITQHNRWIHTSTGVGREGGREKEGARGVGREGGREKEGARGVGGGRRRELGEWGGKEGGT